MNDYQIDNKQLTNEQEVAEFLQEVWEDSITVESRNIGSAQTIKTGIFIQSLKFFNSTEVNLTGYIWQHYKEDHPDSIKPMPGDVGFILPDQVDTNFDPQVVYRKSNGNDEVIGWYFEATLRQPFDYSTYPFDHKTVWVRMWAKGFSENIILVPDFDAYQSTGQKDIFGIEKEIVLANWERENTYFDYKLSSYDTDFGINDYIGQQGFPELHYNFVVKRKFGNAFIVYLLPLLLVAALLFAALLTVSDRDDLSRRFGFSVSGFIGAASALFFVVMIAHIQLREQFPGSGIVYIEYFYILMYALLVAATANTFLFSIKPKRGCGLLLHDDNHLVKVAYWPVVLLCMIVITMLVM